MPGDTSGPGSGGGALTHLDGAGRARMVDVTGKPWTHRRATARCRVSTSSGESPLSAYPAPSWAETLMAARLAGIQAAKQTAMLIPLCHPLTVSHVDVRLSPALSGVDIESVAEATGPTGVEMEALTACAVAALTLVSALGPTRRDVSIEDLTVWEKSGGRSGTWTRT